MNFKVGIETPLLSKQILDEPLPSIPSGPGNKAKSLNENVLVNLARKVKSAWNEMKEFFVNFNDKRNLNRDVKALYNQEKGSSSQLDQFLKKEYGGSDVTGFKKFLRDIKATDDGVNPIYNTDSSSDKIRSWGQKNGHIQNLNYMTDEFSRRLIAINTAKAQYNKNITIL
ncbi:MAG: hypothetical protein K940chlam6_00174 [Chlamydiae bacterium]|nr:hypothetical protein [Chlamydiota bacterium]